MGWLSRKKASRTDAGAAVSDRHSNRADLQHLQEFAASRRGVEAFVEPPTAVTQITIVLVADDGEWTRRRIGSRQTAANFARKLAIPIYDTNRVGYPQRMRDYDLRATKGAPARPTVSAPSVPSASPKQTAALMTLEALAGADPVPDNHTREDLMTLLRQARAKTHPDRHAGDRTAWDKVETAADVLGLKG